MMSVSKLGAAADWSIPLFTPVAVIPERRHTAPAECALLGAMLVVAAKDATYIGNVGDDAREWFASDSIAPYSYLYACDVLGVDPDALRARVLSQPREPQPNGRSTTTAHYATAGGCRVLGCGWQGVDICTDPEKHNPACVRRGDDRVVVPVIQRIVPKCQRCGVESIVRHQVKVRNRTRRVCADCYDLHLAESKQRMAARVNHSAIKSMQRRERIIAEANRNSGKINPPRAALAAGIQRRHAQYVLRDMATAGFLRRIAHGVYEVIR